LKTYTVNIWNIKKQETRNKKQLTRLFYVSLESEKNNKDIYEIRLFLQCKIKFEPPDIKTLNELIASAMAIQKVLASEKRNASNE